MPFCLHLNMLIFDFFFSEFKMISFPLFCLFFFTRISAENLCLTWLFLSTEASPYTELSLVLGVPSSSQTCFPWKLLPKQGSAVKCMIHTLTEQPEKCTQREREFSLDHHENNGVCLAGLVLFLWALKFSKPRELKKLQQLLNSSLLSKTQSRALCCWSTLG